MTRWLLFVLAGGIAATSAGCRTETPSAGGLIPVAGRVTIDGRSASDVVLAFHRMSNDEDGNRDEATGATPIPTGRSDAEGRFVVSTFAPGDGAPPGEYRVTAVRRTGEDGENGLPVRYAAPESSGLAATIRAGVGELPTIALHSQ